jgi:hypothetical protein
MSPQDLADRIEIDDLLTRYATGIDRKEWDLWETCFTGDAHIDYSAFGGTKGNVKEVRKWLEETMAGFPMTQHLVVNREILIDGDAATARSAFYNPMGVPGGDGPDRLFFCGGYYHDKLVRTAEGWRIRERIEEFGYNTMTQRVLQPAK